MTHSLYLGEQLLNKFEDVVQGLGMPYPIHFEELTADPGELPRLMLSPIDNGTQDNAYISGEKICPFPCTVTLRVGIWDEQGSIDAATDLTALSKAFLTKSYILDGYTAYRRPEASIARCLGRTDVFEDWQVTFDLYYKQTN